MNESIPPAQSVHPHPRIPTATYRLQFHAGFRFSDATAIVDYLAELGISDVYASPFFQAGEGSPHGYDVADHNRLNPELGDGVDFRTYIAALRQANLGQVLDFVPNHMGVAETVNRWWMEVLEDGILSEYTRYFDIDWFPGKQALWQKLVLPALGEPYGATLESGALRLVYEDGAFWIEIPGRRLPVCPRTYRMIFERIHGLPETVARAVEELGRIFASCPGVEKVKAKQRLREMVHHDPRLHAALQDAVAGFAGRPGEPESFKPLHELLDQQVYRLSYWRFAAEEINYRRFFDINTLAAIRVEVPEVFDASHQYILELLARGDVTGIRIDHIDGLWDPQAYLQRLQEKYARVCGLPENSQGLYLVTEKILDFREEALPSDWPVHGTTGYEFANQVVHLFVDPSAKTPLTRAYASHAGEQVDFSEMVYEKKLRVLDRSFPSEVAALARRLDEISEMHWHYRDFSLHALTLVLQEVIACFPVYRCYVSDSHFPDEQERRHVTRAVSLARRRNPSLDKSLFVFIRKILLREWPDDLTDDQRTLLMNFVMKFQQTTGPVMAKGLEDTTFYLFNRLIALNEVGGNPGAFGLAVEEFHRINQDRQEKFPATLLASSTHDTKRSEDVRMRIAALTEIPRKWTTSVAKWFRWNRKHHRNLDGEMAPSANEEYLLYQTLVGAWPVPGASEEEWNTFRERIQAYFLKAIKEGKTNSSWTDANEEWEAAAAAFVERILDRKGNPRFWEDCAQLAGEAALIGAMNSLSATVLKATVPGVPDFYQGTEIWDDSLVDPDNRRPIDYGLRRKILQQIQQKTPSELLQDWRSGGIKCWVIRALLRHRREHPEFFFRADYRPVSVSGEFADRVVAFQRVHEGNSLTVAVARCASVVGTPALGELWRDTALEMDAWAGDELLSGRKRTFSGSLRDLFAVLPCAVVWHRATT